MKVKINQYAIAIGHVAADTDLAAAGFERRSLLQRLLRKEPQGGMVFEAKNCVVTCFDDGFEMYPCTHSYLTPDRRWNTAASVLVVDGRIRSAVLRVLDAKYAASEFVSRFHEVCTGVLGQPRTSDRYTTRWQNGSTSVTSLIQPDAKNACFLFEADPVAVTT